MDTNVTLSVNPWEKHQKHMWYCKYFDLIAESVFREERVLLYFIFYNYIIICKGSNLLQLVYNNC